MKRPGEPMRSKFFRADRFSPRPRFRASTVSRSSHARHMVSSSPPNSRRRFACGDRCNLPNLKGDHHCPLFTSCNSMLKLRPMMSLARLVLSSYRCPPLPRRTRSCRAQRGSCTPIRTASHLTKSQCILSHSNECCTASRQFEKKELWVPGHCHRLKVPAWSLRCFANSLCPQLLSGCSLNEGTDVANRPQVCLQFFRFGEETFIAQKIYGTDQLMEATLSLCVQIAETRGAATKKFSKQYPVVSSDSIQRKVSLDELPEATFPSTARARGPRGSR